MVYSMNTYARSSNNPYARKYLTKGRKSSESFDYLDGKAYLMEPKNKKIKRIVHDTNFAQHIIKSAPYNLFNDDSEIHNDFNDFCEFDRVQAIPTDNYNYLNYNENQNIGDENAECFEDSMEEYCIDYIEDTFPIENISYSHQQDPPLFNGSFSDTQFVLPPIKSKRKQGIVGRPTLSSPKRLLVPDNVYSHANIMSTNSDIDKFFTDNNHRVRHSYNSRNVNKKTFIQSDTEEPQRGVGRSRPRILLKPSMSDYRYSNEPQYNYNPIEQDAKEVAQRQVANREFARNLVARAQRQGTVIDKNKIPLSVFQQEPVDRMFRSSLDHHLSEVAEIKESEQLVSQPYTTTISIADSRKPAPIVVKKSDIVPPLVRLTASDILKQKWKAASRNQL